MIDLAAAHDPLREAHGLREQLSSHTRRLGLFLGAGTSMAAGLEGIDGLTAGVGSELGEESSAVYQHLLQELGEGATVEDVLNKVRLYIEYFAGNDNKEVDGLTLPRVTALDREICSSVVELLNVDPPRGLKSHMTLAEWIRVIPRDHPVEIFTTNYDLLVERALEEAAVPFFDGFLGAVAPFFVQESVEADGSRETRNVYPPAGWTRLWKVHGSIGWRVRGGPGQRRIVRILGQAPQPGEELLIYPTREKYVDSRRLPFMTYFDRLRRFLSSGESLLLVIGYSFRDEHINEIIIEALRANNRLAVTALLYSPPPATLVAQARTFRNLSLLGPESACVAGLVGRWSEPSTQKSEAAQWPFWDEGNKRFTLGDFRRFGEYLERMIGLTASSASPESSRSEKSDED